MKKQSLSRFAVLPLLALAQLVADRPFVQTAGAAPADRPNIIFILSDDYGLDGVGCYGSDHFKTPNIDALAQTGLRFENAYCTPLCGPTRCLLNTGRYGFRTGGMSNQTARNPSPTEEPAIARMLKQAGYATGHCGKWRQVGATPGDWGFEEYITDPTAGGWYWQKSYTKNGQTVESDKEVYYPDVCHQFALDFITKHRNQPFFFYYASHLVHGPILRTPDTKPGTTDGDSFYRDNVNYLDKQVGDLVAHVDKLGLREKTLIIFSADNGTAKASRTIKGRQISGQKGTMLEGGAHVPFIANWKGVTPAGKSAKDLVDFSDLFPTFAELAGGRMPEGVTFDGRSFAPQLRGQPGNPREWIFVQLGRNWYTREMGWKLNNRGELFDMADAPFVEKPVAAGAGDAAADAARKRLQSVLDKLNPAGGKVEPQAAEGGKKKERKKRNRE
jgi:arylsulfatase A-like enzyme